MTAHTAVDTEKAAMAASPILSADGPTMSTNGRAAAVLIGSKANTMVMIDVDSAAANSDNV